MCFTEAPDRVAFAKPEGYDAHRYELFARLIEARTKAEGHVPPLATVLSIGRLPNGTTDINNNGAFSTDYIGGSWEYPNATYARREHDLAGAQEVSGGILLFPGDRSRNCRPACAPR